jgi:hypothetical protein
VIAIVNGRRTPFFTALAWMLTELIIDPHGWSISWGGVPRKLKCAGCQLGDHCNGEDDSCYCECTERADPP